jgi:hypothetical protein
MNKLRGDYNTKEESKMKGKSMPSGKTGEVFPQCEN